MSSGKDSNKYELSMTLVSDGDPVRALTVLSPSLDDEKEENEADSSSVYSILSGSENGMVSLFTVPTRDFVFGGPDSTHPHHITALLAIPEEFNHDTNKEENSIVGGYVTGCKDGNVRIFSSTHRLLFTLSEHGNAVTSLSWLYFTNMAKPMLISGSWDGSAKIWNLQHNNNNSVATLTGHENTVSVVGLPSPPSSAPTTTGGITARVATGSAGIASGNVIRDHSVRIWAITLPSTDNINNANVQLITKVSNDHQGPIRDITYDYQTQHIITCSNDGTVKIRDDQTAATLQTLSYPPHKLNQVPMLLSVKCLGKAKYVATTEDGNAIVWDTRVPSDGTDDEMTQVIGHPNCVWTVIPLPSDNFATACHDGNIRIFTTNPNHFATRDEIDQFETAVKESRMKMSSGPSPEEINKLPKWEMNALQHGRSEGQVQLFNKSGKAIAAQWSSSSQTWIEVGEVTGTNPNAGVIDGVSYDHVLPIEVDVSGGGVQKLSIGYNNGENPFVVAQKFIDEHMLDQNYLSRIADYIRQRVGDSGVTIGGNSNTSAGAAAAAASASASSARRGMEVHSGPIPMDISEVTTGPSYKYLPMKGYKSFETGTDMKTLSKILTKIREFNTSITTNLTESQVTATLDELCDTLSKTSRYHATKINNDALLVIQKMIQHWDCERCFPALDLARLVVLHPDGSRGDRKDYWSEVIQLALQKCKHVTEQKVEGTAAFAVPMLSLRLFANCFRGGSGSVAAVSSNLKSVLSCAENFALSSNKNVRLSVATLVLNASSFMFTHRGEHDSSPEQILTIVGTILGSGLYETEAAVRSLVALGTALLADNGEAKAKAKSLHMSSMVQHVAKGGKHGDKAQDIADEILMVMG